MALNSIAQNASRIVGPPLAGFIAAWSIGACFVFVAATRGLSLIYTMLLSRRTQAPNDSTENPVQQIVSGFRYLFSDIDLTLLLLLNALAALLVWPYVQFMPVFAEDVFGGNAQTYGWLVSMIAVGSIVGLFGLAWFPNVRYRGWIMLGSFIVYDALLIGFTQAPVLSVALATLATAGVFFGLASTLSHTFFQAMLRPDMRGRGLAALQVAVGLAPLGALPMGFLIDAIGIRNGVAIHFVLALTSMVIVTALGRSLRKL
jgi:MFS family permease